MNGLKKGDNMKNISESIKYARNEMFSPETVYKDLRDEVLIGERVLYKGDYYLHRGFINAFSVPLYLGAIDKDHFNPHFMPNDKEFYKGFIREIKESGLSDEELRINIPYMAILYTNNYFRSTCSKKSEGYKKIFEEFKARKLKEGNYTDAELRSMLRVKVYEAFKPSSTKTSAAYIVSQNIFKNIDAAMCVEINSSYANLLALLGYDIYVVTGFIYVCNRNSGHCYPLVRIDSGNSYAILDLTMNCFGGKIINPLQGYRLKLTSRYNDDIIYKLPSFTDGTSSLQPILRK